MPQAISPSTIKIIENKNKRQSAFAKTNSPPLLNHPPGILYSKLAIVEHRDKLVSPFQISDPHNKKPSSPN